MWSYEELMGKETWTVDDIPPELRLLIDEHALACIVDEGDELDHGLILHLAYEAVFERPEPETPEWVEAVIEANPGLWVARLCRAMHGLPENFRSIAWCGQCSGGYANPRKRRRAANLPPQTLPGFESIGGAFQLHPPCSRRDLTWLRHLIYRLVQRGQVEKRREKRPDLRQARGWDWMSTLYPLDRKDD